MTFYIKGIFAAVCEYRVSLSENLQLPQLCGCVFTNLVCVILSTLLAYANAFQCIQISGVLWTEIRWQILFFCLSFFCLI